MRTIHVDSITEAVEKLCMDSNYYLNDDIINAWKKGLKKKNRTMAKRF